MSEIAKKVRRLREGKGLSQSELARAIGVTPQSIQALEDGKVRQPKYILELAQALGVDPGALRRIETSEGIEPNAVVVGPVEFPTSKIPVYGQAVGGVDGEFEMNGQFVQEVICPPALLNVSDAYAVLVSGESMEPRYYDGELLYVHPHRRPRRGDFIVAQIKQEEHGPIMAFIKRLVRWNSKELVISQFNPDKELLFPSGEVVSVHVVVGTGDNLNFI